MEYNRWAHIVFASTIREKYQERLACGELYCTWDWDSQISCCYLYKNIWGARRTSPTNKARLKVKYRDENKQVQESFLGFLYSKIWIKASSWTRPFSFLLLFATFYNVDLRCFFFPLFNITFLYFGERRWLCYPLH